MNKYFFYLKILSVNVKKKCPRRLLLEVGAGDVRGGADAQPEKQPRSSLPW
jgi:hypothetical protein